MAFENGLLIGFHFHFCNNESVKHISFCQSVCAVQELTLTNCKFSGLIPFPFNAEQNFN